MRKLARPELIGMLVVGVFIAAFGSAVPQRDDIDFLRTSELIRNRVSWTQVLTSDDLWASWNGHRQVIPRLLASGLLRIGHGDFRVLMAASLVIAALTIPAVVLILPATVPHRRSLAALTVFALSQSENWLWGYQLAWFLVNFGVLWALAFAMRAYASAEFEGVDRTVSPKAFIVLAFGAFMSCAIATLSSAHGVLSWFAVACVCGLLGRWRATLVWAPLGVLGVFAVRSNDWTTLPSPLRVVTVALQLVGCVLKLPAAWIRRDLPGGAAVPLVIGIAITLMMATFTLVTVRGGRVRRRQASGLLGLEIYIVGFVVMVSSARSDPLYETPAQSRYSTVTLLGLLALIALAAHVRSDAPPRGSAILFSSRWLAIAGCGVLVGVSVTALPSVRGWQRSVVVIERCVAEWKPAVARQPDCKYAWDGPLDAEWKALKKR